MLSLSMMIEVGLYLSLPELEMIPNTFDEILATSRVNELLLNLNLTQTLFLTVTPDFLSTHSSKEAEAIIPLDLNPYPFEKERQVRDVYSVPFEISLLLLSSSNTKKKEIIRARKELLHLLSYCIKMKIPEQVETVSVQTLMYVNHFFSSDKVNFNEGTRALGIKCLSQERDENINLIRLVLSIPPNSRFLEMFKILCYTAVTFEDSNDTFEKLYQLGITFEDYKEVQSQVKKHPEMYLIFEMAEKVEIMEYLQCRNFVGSPYFPVMNSNSGNHLLATYGERHNKYVWLRW